METRSAQPSRRTLSAVSGELILLDVIRGAPTKPISFPVTHAKARLGTIAAIVGIGASCHPMPVLMMSAPAFSTASASSTTWSQFDPSGTRSSIESR